MNTGKTEREVIGDFVELRFTNLPSSLFMRGKVDTGATICSLHCDGHEINEERNQISFKCSHLSSNTITMPLTDRQAVKSADNGTEYRPVIEMSVKIGDRVIENVKFNLNDRSKMDCPILIGQNLIKAGDYLIDPKQVSEAEGNMADLDAVALADIEAGAPTSDQAEELDDIEELKNSVESDSIDRTLQIEVIYQLMKNSDITLSEIIDFAEAHTTDDKVTVSTKPTDTIE